jgi:RHS repeat-associated protein
MFVTEFRFLTEVKDRKVSGDNGKPHALTGISGVPTNFPTDSLNVTYTDFRKIKTLTEGNNYYILTYGIDDQRRKSEYKINGITQKTKYYLGDYEEETDNLGNTKKIHYLSGGAILINTNGVETLYYGYSDYQGNLIALANEAGTVVERYAYDPWGKRRNPADWTQDDTRTSWIIVRGYTMHEHLDQFGIINMNGRVYDPLTAMFFSPDPFVQAPGNWLNYNRYAYCYGNPFKYTDPSGESVIVMIGLTLIGGYLGGVATNYGELNPGEWDWENPGTYCGLIFGMFMGYTGGYWLYHPGALGVNLSLSINGQWGSAAIGVGGIGATGSFSNWDFHWSTSAGGGGTIPLGERKPAVISIPEKSKWEGRYFKGNEKEAQQLLLESSKLFGVETSYWYTSKGYFFESIQGNAYDFEYLEDLGLFPSNDRFTVLDYNVEIGFKSNTISRTYRYTSIENTEYGLFLNLNTFERSRVYYKSHTHPHSNPPSGGDHLFSNLLKLRGRVYGWNGTKFDYYRDKNNW